MTVHSLPLYIDPIRLADTHSQFEGDIAANQLHDLDGIINRFVANIHVKLQFGIDFENLRFVQGEVATTVELVCQRCMQSYDYPINSQFNLSPVNNEQEAERLPPHYDALLLTDNIKLGDIITEEVLLALPLVPMHVESECSVKLAQAAEPIKVNPFAGLAILKDKLKK